MLNFKGVLKKSNVFTKFLTLVGFVCFFTLSAILVWNLVTNGDNSNIESLKILQMAQTIGMFILPSLLCVYLWSEQPIIFLNLNKKTGASDALLLIIIMFLAIPFINLLGDFNQQLHLPKELSYVEEWMKVSELQEKNLTEKMLSVSSIEGLLLNILLIAMLPAMGEELFFRGVIQKVITDRKNPIIAIWITAIIFSTIHFQFYGFLPRLLLGAFFGYILLWSGNLWLPILAHFINNFIAVVFYYLSYNGYKIINIDTIGTDNTNWIGLVSFAAIIFAIQFLEKKFTRQYRA